MMFIFSLLIIRRCLTQRTQRRATSRSSSPSSSRIFTSTSSTSTTTAMESKRTEQKSAMGMDLHRAKEQVVMDHYQTAARLHHRGAVWLFQQIFKISNEYRISIVKRTQMKVVIWKLLQVYFGVWFCLNCNQVE